MPETRERSRREAATPRTGWPHIFVIEPLGTVRTALVVAQTHTGAGDGAHPMGHMGLNMHAHSHTQKSVRKAGVIRVSLMD